MLNGQWPTAVQRGDPARARRKPNSVPANCCLAIPLFSFIIHPLAFIIRSVSVKKSGVTLDGTAEQPYDALLVVSFGGPERREDVIPFLENVVRGKNVPRERMLSVAEHYYQCGGHSPINDQNRALIGALKAEFERFGPPLPIYWGNRNWHPLLPDALRQMAADGVRRCWRFSPQPIAPTRVAGSTARTSPRRRPKSALDAPGRAAARVLQPPAVYRVDGRARRRGAREHSPGSARGRAGDLHGTQHSAGDGAQLPVRVRNCARPASSSPRRIQTDMWRLAYQSRSGPPSQPWLVPDVGDTLRDLARAVARCRRRTHRFPFRPPGNPLRSRCRSQETGRRCRAQHGGAPARPAPTRRLWR